MIVTRVKRRRATAPMKVIDFAMGSGSTAIACRNTGRRFIGIEIQRDIFQTALKRITDE